MELSAYEVRADEVQVGDVMQHRPVLDSGMGRARDAKVIEVDLEDPAEVWVVLDGHYAYPYGPSDMVVVYRP